MENFDWRHFFKVLIITIVVTIFVIFLWVVLQLNGAVDYNFRIFPKHKLLKHAKTGDLIGISYPSLRGQLVKVFCGSCWCHVCMIVVNKEGPQVLEIGRYSRERRGVLLTPLKEWLELNDERIIGWRPYHGNIEKKKIMQFIEEYKHLKEDMNVVSWLKCMITWKYHKKPEKDKFFCSEFMSFLMQEVGILEKKYDPASYRPVELMTRKLDLNIGHYYDQPLILE